MASIPAAWAVYFVSRNSSDNSQPFVTRMIDGYTETSEKWSKRNDLHVRMIEQAGEDRVLFQNTRPQEHVEMKFPEYVAPSLNFSIARDACCSASSKNRARLEDL
jgi:hypothetical protein